VERKRLSDLIKEGVGIKEEDGKFGVKWNEIMGFLFHG